MSKSSFPTAMREILNSVVSNRAGAFIFLVGAAFLEAYGDSCFQMGLYRSSGSTRALGFAAGALALAAYGLMVNVPRWDFGRLLGVYVMVFFLLAQVIARVRFGQIPNTPIVIGGAMIFAGGLVITVWGK